MVRYVKQRDETSCGPVAIINIFKWMNCNVTYDFIHTARLFCKWEDGRRNGGGGTTNLDLEYALKIFGIKNKRIIKPTLEDIDNHIDSGGIVLIGYSNPYYMPGFMNKDEDHFALCIGRTENSYTMVNDNGKTISKRFRSVMKVMLRREVDGYKCWTWLINK